METYFQDLFRYNDWANERVIRAITSQNLEHHTRIIQLMSHLLSAQFVWHLRIKSLPTTAFPIWEIYKINELVSMNEDSTRNWLQLIASEKDYQKLINYTNSKGQEYSHCIQYILTHVINHSTYHRGQIALLVKNEGLSPAASDYIVYARDGNT